MKNIIILVVLMQFVFFVTLLACDSDNNSLPYINHNYDSVPLSDLSIADPYIFQWDEKFYAYGTGEKGFRAYISTDLKKWKKGSMALVPENSYGEKNFWAPEVYYVASKNKFYMLYTVEEHICIASSDFPEGPFINESRSSLIPDEKSIDASLFIDDDGTAYVYFVRFTGGNVIWCAQLNKDWSCIKKETLKQCINSTEKWELVNDKVTEGPSVVKHLGKYYIIYSANHFQSQDYAVGYATSNTPTGPWIKSKDSPILHRSNPSAENLVGTGHGAPFIDKSGKWRYIFHAHKNKSEVSPRHSYILDMYFTNDGKIKIGGKLIRPTIEK